MDFGSQNVDFGALLAPFGSQMGPKGFQNTIPKNEEKKGPGKRGPKVEPEEKFLPLALLIPEPRPPQWIKDPCPKG